MRTSMPYRFQRPATEQWQQCSAIPDIIARKLCPIRRQKWQIFFNFVAFSAQSCGAWRREGGWLSPACMLRAADTLRTSGVASNSLVPCLDTVGRMLGVIAQPQKGHPWLEPPLAATHRSFSTAAALSAAFLQASPIIGHYRQHRQAAGQLWGRPTACLPLILAK